MLISGDLMNYRRLWESHYGPIPKDEEGFSYEIHHIDGDHKNDNISNLKLVTIKEHLNIHLQQEDWFAAALIAKRIGLGPDYISSLQRGKKRPGVGGRKKGTKWSAAERETQQALRSSPDFYNYLYDPIRCQKISNSLRGRQGSAEGKKWFNNGVKETYDTICPEGYSLGRLSRTQPNKQGMKWYNNGKVNRQFKDNFVEQGFMRGRISKK